jgi:hypothetical protein
MDQRTHPPAKDVALQAEPPLGLRDLDAAAAKQPRAAGDALVAHAQVEGLHDLGRGGWGGLSSRGVWT